MPSEDLDVVARFAALLASLGPHGSVTERFCEAGRLMLGADGAAITLSYDQAARHTWTAADGFAALIEDAQEVAGEGPGPDAERSGKVVRGSFGSPGSSPWPLLVDRIAAAGFTGTVLAVPLLIDGGLVGVLVVHRSVVGYEFDQAIAAFLSRTIGVALLEEIPADAIEDELNRNWPVRAILHQATGMVVAQLGIQPIDALAVLRGHAYAHDLTLAEVSGAVVERRIRFDDSAGTAD